MELDEFLKKINEYNPQADVKLIKKAFTFAKIAHEGQKRVSGEDYFTHPLEVAKILIEQKADSSTICASLLHDVLEDTKIDSKEVKRVFGDEICELVEGLTKIDKVHFDSKEDYNAENLRKILLATTKDIRIILIKLSDRLHNMRTLETFKEDKRRRISKQTMEIYAPIAHKLGMWKAKGELEDLSLRYLEPEVYTKIRKKINQKRGQREKVTQEIINVIKQKLDEKEIKSRVTGRAKYFYSIYRKMLKKKINIDQMYDLIAIRIITATIPDCYAALGMIHDLWKPLPHRFKDLIAIPKANGYQSLHTTVIARDGRMLEVQIRTVDMHHLAEEGVAAHWKYKGTERDKAFDKKISWLKQILDWKQTSGASEFIDTFKIDLFHDEIVVFTPKGDPISLPVGSTPVDFAFMVHSDVGEKCSKAKVNGKIVPLDTELSSGEICEIITQKNAKPSRQWLKFVKTSKARSKIRVRLNIEVDHDPKKGRLRKERDKDREFAENPLQYLAVEGKQAPLKLSKCCEPKIGDEILGFYTKDRKITVHKKSCVNVATLDKKKEVKIKWTKDKQKNEIEVTLALEDKVGILALILNIFVQHRVNISSLNTKAKKDHVVNKIRLFLDDREILEEVLKKIRKLDGVLDAKES
jgi:GTP diphosphokinase / guanosine-3',5'-bis(diphosphate) 3'-diphosphatase